MTKLTTSLVAASLLTLAPQMAQASNQDQNMPGLTGSVPAKAPATEEDDLDKQIAAEEARKKQLDEKAKAQEEKRKKLEALKAENDKKQQDLTVGQKVGRETDRVLDQAAKQTQRLAGHLKKKKF